MESLCPLRLDGIARPTGVAVLVFPLGEIDAAIFMRFLRLACGLPERVVLVRPRVEWVPHVPPGQRAEVKPLGDGLQVVDFRYGFDDDPDVPRALSGAADRLQLDRTPAHYYVVDDRASAAYARGLPRWRRWLFVAMSALCMPAAEFFHLPAERTTEIANVYGTKR